MQSKVEILMPKHHTIKIQKLSGSFLTPQKHLDA